MLVKVDEFWVNPKYVVRIQDLTIGVHKWVIVVTNDEGCAGGAIEIGSKGVTSDLVAMFLNECEQGLTRTWEEFLEQEVGE